MGQILMRVDGWETRLDKYIHDAREKTFCYGEFDCVLFVADCVQLIVGNDFAFEYRGRYHDEKESTIILHKKYCETVENVMDLFAMRYSDIFSSVSVSKAKRGDICCMDHSTREGSKATGLGICIGDKAAFPSLEGGLSFMKMERVRRAWAVK